MTVAWYDDALEVLAANAGRPLPAHLSWLVFRGHRAHVLIPCDDVGPLGVIRRWNDEGVAEHEIAILGRLQNEEAPSVLKTLPKPLSAFRSGRTLVSTQSWLSGSPMRIWSTPKSRAAALRHLSAFRTWLGLRLNNRQTAAIVPNHAADSLLRRIARRTPDGPAHRALQDFLTGVADTARAEHGVLHNDLNPGNLLLDDAGSISGVLDWEHAGPGPLICDWIGFVNQLALALTAGDVHAVSTVQQALKEAWSDPGWLQRAVRAETIKLRELSQASSPALEACWRLATFRGAYASLRDETPAAQLAISQWLTARAAPDFIRD